MVRQRFFQLLFVSFVFMSLISCKPGDVVVVPTAIDKLVETRESPPPAATLGIMEMAPIQPRPLYIQAIGPEEYSVVPLDLFNYIPKGQENVGMAVGDPEDGYQSTICLLLSGETLAQEGDDLSQDGIMVERMALLVNNEPMETVNSIQMGIPTVRMSDEVDGIRTIWVEGEDWCWHAPLGPGQHRITFKFRQTSGDIQEYTWFFEIRE